MLSRLPGHLATYFMPKLISFVLMLLSDGQMCQARSAGVGVHMCMRTCILICCMSTLAYQQDNMQGSQYMTAPPWKDI